MKYYKLAAAQGNERASAVINENSFVFFKFTKEEGYSRQRTNNPTNVRLDQYIAKKRILQEQNTSQRSQHP